MEGKEMNKKKIYTDEFKTKVIMEVLKEEKTLIEISSEFEVHKCTIREWKKQFMQNILLAINPEKGLDKYKKALEEEKKEKEELYKQIGKLTTQLDWAKKKSEQFGFKD